MTSTPPIERTWPQILGALLAGDDLGRDDTAWAMDQVMSGSATSAQLAGFLIGLRGKGETVQELSGLVDAMLAHAIRIEVPGPAVDVVGTGGDRRHTVNISTMAALVVAGTGRRVVKHGNRAASSSTGTADVLEALGVRLDLAPERVAALAQEVGITFCFAQAFHPAFRHAGPTRRELGVPTVFNALGPLTNPAQPAAAAVGVAVPWLGPMLAGVFADRGTSALVFVGEDGLDELSTTAPSRLWEIAEGQISEHRIDAADLGLARTDLADLRGADPAFNAQVVRSVLAGESGPIRDTVLLNAAAGIVAFDAAGGGGQTDLMERLGRALQEGAEALDDGRVRDVLERWTAASAKD